jgi:hypothetical protein
MAFFEEINLIKETLARMIEARGGVYADAFSETATVASVSDPEELGRVKVTYQDGGTSDWIYVLGSNKGTLSAQFIGTPCLVGKAHGRSEDAFVLGFFNKNAEIAFPGSSPQVAILSEQLQAYAAPASPGDQGLRCNEGNAGRVYIFDNEMNQDLVVCLRRNNRQESNEKIWAWKSLTHGKWVEKGLDPQAADLPTVTDFSEKQGIPQCSKAQEGEIHEFAEDRKFRSTMIMCRRDENGDFSWGPMSSPPVVFKTLLPKCDEKAHGTEVVVDSGRDSELAICLRYQGEMKWVHHTTREPVQFHREDLPLTRPQFLDAKKPMAALAAETAAGPGDWLGKAAASGILDLVVKAIPGINSDPKLRAAAEAAGLYPPSFNPTQTVSDITDFILASNSGSEMSRSDVREMVKKAEEDGEVRDEKFKKILENSGATGKKLTEGISSGDVNSSYQAIGKGAISQALGQVDRASQSIITAYGAGGLLGAIDTAAMLGVSKLPPQVAGVATPLLRAASSVLSTQPKAISNMLNAAAGLGTQSIPGVVGSLVGIAGGPGGIASALSSGVLSSLQTGQLGPIAQMLGSFAGLPGIPNLGGIGGVPQLATSALQLLGLGGQFSAFLGPAGLGLSAFAALTGINPITSILGGIPGLGGLFGGGGADCPCDPKCRKTSHGEDSDGLKLLDPCGNVVANSHSSYDPIGNPVENNKNKVAETLGRINTVIGEELCVSNPYDLTEMIQKVKRLGEMADKLENAKNADWPELWTEMMYTFETIQKAFKQTDNNITGIESVERKLIDAQHRLITKMMIGNGSFFSRALISIVDTSKAVRDLYGFVTALNAKKKGGKAGIFATESLKIVFENIIKIAALNSASKAEAKFILSNVVNPADSEWRKLAPALGLTSLTDFVLGAVPKDLPLNFSKCKTIRDENKVLKDSLESKLNSLVPPSNDSAILSKLPQSISDLAGLPGSAGAGVPTISSPGTPDASDTSIGTSDAFGTPGTLGASGPPGTPGGVNTEQIKDILDQIKYNQDRSNSGQADC